jgi:hypothetical protein
MLQMTDDIEAGDLKNRQALLVTTSLSVDDSFMPQVLFG